jgi:hypothetical protein
MRHRRRGRRSYRYGIGRLRKSRGRRLRGYHASRGGIRL